MNFEVTSGHVEKGQELGYFSYGGSTLCLLFQKYAIGKFVFMRSTPVDPANPPTIQVGAAIASTVPWNPAYDVGAVPV